MKRILFILSLLLFQSTLFQIDAQPQKSRLNNGTNKTASNRRTTTRRTTGNNKSAQSQTATVSRAELMFPTAVDVPQEVDWRRDLYRELDLTKDENAALYYPVQPQGNQMNLFSLMFKLFSTGKLPVYKYDDVHEDFTPSKRMHFKDFLENFSIYYEMQGNSYKIDNSDIPSGQVLSYYIKESNYYDQNTATYHTRVTALCPIYHDNLGYGSAPVVESDEEGGEVDEFSSGFAGTKKPMFWVKYEDIAPYLSSYTIMTSNVNNAAVMSMADFFATNKYKGTVYMTNNMQGKLLSDLAKGGDVKKEQARIEKELKDFEQNIWTTPVDSAELARQDSIAKLQNSKRKTVSNSNTRRGESSTGNTTVQKSTTKEKKSKSSSSPRVSVRRQRH
ncbi:MAG: gliding motility protein GldN [Bacteroidaceae bacterium]|jgi:gliding motility associated protien GldN|nr:gliding motility protein GldN [Bacteroidaceae bacterium]